MKQFTGLPASPGIAIGPVWVYAPTAVAIPTHTVANPLEETKRFHEALKTAESQLQALEKHTLETIGYEEAAIFEAHQLFLQDPDLIESVEMLIEGEQVNAEAAVSQAIAEYAEALLAVEDEYFQARAVDVQDVGQRVIRILLGVGEEKAAFPDAPTIVLADDLTPSDTVQFPKDRLLALATVRGGPTSHTAILARSLGIPAIVSLPLPLALISGDSVLILDGSTGQVTLNPDEATLQQAKSAQTAWQQQQDVELKAAMATAVTTDGHQVEIVANIGGAADAQTALTYGAEGVGLFRTEFLYLDRDSMPTEDEQTAAYQEIFEIMGERPLVVRTLDIGGDKAVSYLGFTAEPNPFLGWRAIRMMDERPDVLHDQFRALLRAAGATSQPTDLRIMVPMVSNLGEIKQARAMLDKAQTELVNEGVIVPEKVQFGIMVEIPAAALLVPHFSNYVDFFSIGTNDLTQYTLAVDRTNERVAALATPYHPAVLNLIATTIFNAHKHGKWVGLCGEFAGDPLAAPLLLGLGLDEFSMAPAAIPAVKAMLRRCSRVVCHGIAAHVLELATAKEVKAYLQEKVAEMA
ncbi:MAG: phosphoenolpyruvate--protein phosphotransferase [Chloroflexota bacterium]